MSGFLSGLVQRGAELPGSGAGTALTAAPLAPAQAASPGGLEVTAEVDGAPPVPASTSAPSVQSQAVDEPIVHQEPQVRTVDQHVHITHLSASPPRAIHQTRGIAPAPAATPTDAAPVNLEPNRGAARPLSTSVERAGAEPQYQVVRTDDGTRVQPEAQTVGVIGNELEQVESPAIVPRESRPAASELPETRIEPAPIESPAFRRLDLQPAPSMRAPQPPPIHVRIGRVEVRPPAPAAAPPAPKKANGAAALGFAAYRRLRTYR